MANRQQGNTVLGQPAFYAMPSSDVQQRNDYYAKQNPSEFPQYPQSLPHQYYPPSIPPNQQADGQFSHSVSTPPFAPSYGSGVPHHSQYAQQGPPGEWSSGICGCCKDCTSCGLTCIVPCITFGQIAEILDEGQTSCALSGIIYCVLWHFGICCVYSCLYRSKMRKKFGLKESPCDDFCLHCCCEHCALCQEYRELKHRGLDPALGWRPQPSQPMAAPVPPHMAR